MTKTYRIHVDNRQQALELQTERMEQAIRSVLAGEGVVTACVNVAVVGNDEIHQINREYLDHDFETDVISFSLGEVGGPLEGELMVSAEKAVEMAPHYGWLPQDELDLYVIHGTLHLVGYDDACAAAERVMRARETHYLLAAGIDVTHRVGDPGESDFTSLPTGGETT